METINADTTLTEAVAVEGEALAAEPTAEEQALIRKQQMIKAVGMAMKDYSAMIPRIKDLTNYLSHRKLKKVMMAALTFPINEKPTEFKKGSAEEQLFLMIVQSQMAKNLVVGFYNSDTDLVSEVVNSLTEEVQDGME